LHRIDPARYSDLLSDYTELRFQRNSRKTISLVRGNLVRNEQDTTSGVSARVRRSGSWGFASHTDITDESVRTVVKSAQRNAEFLDSRLNKGLASFSPMAPSFSADYSTDKPKLSQGEIMDFVRAVDAHIAERYPDLADRAINLGSLDMEKHMVNSDGARSYSMVPRTNIYVTLTLARDGQPIQVSENFGGLGQFEDLFSDPSDLFEEIHQSYEHLGKKSEGVHPEAGLQQCILDARLAGILAHEAIGHTTDEQVASKLVTLVDFAHTYQGQTCPVPVFIDDEGVRAEDVVIIKNGVLKEFMHNRDTAQRFGVQPKGNARAFAYSDEPLIRMRNTAILPGSSKLEDMIASVEDGYYLMKPSRTANSVGRLRIPLSRALLSIC